MASSKKIGFLWGEEKLTLVDYKKNAPIQVYTAPLGSKSNIASPFSSSLTEDIQITAVLQKLLQDNRISGRSFYVSLPMKEIILRSFIIPHLKQDEIQNAIKFEAKKYLPIDIQDLTFVYYATPFTENKIKRMQIIFFAVRKELLDRYQHIFNQVNSVVSYCEPCMVSLAKVLLSKKDIGPQDSVAFLILDKSLGRICFIDQGIPQFIREFFISTQSPLDETKDSAETLNLKIVNEVGNSFDFYVRQFSGDRIGEMLVSAEGYGEELFTSLETELKIKLKKVAPIATVGGPNSQNHDMDTIYAMGACIDPPMESLSGLNFLEDKASKSKFNINISDFIRTYKEIIFVFVMSVILLFGMNILFKVQLKVAQTKYTQLSSKEGIYLMMPVESLQDDLTQATDKLTAYKGIRTKSDVVLVLFKIASHLPKGSKLKTLAIDYDASDPNSNHVVIDMQGEVVGDDPNEQIIIVNQIFSDFKKDKELAELVKTVNLVSLNRTEQSTEFNIHCN